VKNTEISACLFRATDGLAQALTDTILFIFFLYGDSFGKRGSYGIYKTFEEAQQDLSSINYQSIKRAINNLTKTQYIKRTSGQTGMEIEITKEGLSRIFTKFPSYRTHRPWDGNMYLISYDIPSHENWKRDMLRNYIKRTGGGLLQESLWLTPYNPKTLLEDFSRQHHIDGTILISKLGKDGTIGAETIQELINRIYTLNELEKRYRQFIHMYGRTTKAPLFSATFAYHSILKDDPQLPFALEPPKFPATEAYRLFTKIKRSVLST
jgi:DNA-binding transcriptional regulator PaaX